MSKLQGKVALVTGASKGIGAGIARKLAVAGAAIVVNYAADRTATRKPWSARSRRPTEEPSRSRAACPNSDEVARMLAVVTRAFGRLDILVNNAGVYAAMALDELTEEEFHREINVNLLGPLLIIRESLNHFGPNGGSIINIGSGASTMCPPGYSIYAASKSALDAITGVLAKELAPRNIRVNSVNPGATLSEGTRAAGLYGVGSEFEKELVARTPLGRIGTPSDVAKVVAFLASDDSGWLTGEVILASGGQR